ncbi:MAG: hypothetical protein CEN89_49 [Candidatus Berkelbacteria bacterium Licking1014_7]|uniref:Prolow-density lipoprotein receptor-related protein 1-like beta-propeller domain-containing protein n=1 Tax=Candidatus Berkelbacteria bacterium Licking1014_7 TaxID=2017147 RepID=A0A554LKW9_9BACT|nr:MAG: hypothetical protein CEN89_49 [Candidatus Berkelbacteria bacterium Licking1014_7]
MNKVKIIIVALIAVLLMALIALAVFWLRAKKSQPQTPNDIVDVLPNLSDSAKKIFDEQINSYCIDNSQNTFYFSTNGEPAKIQKLALDNPAGGQAETIFVSDKINYVSNLQCSRNFLLFEAQDLGSPEQIGDNVIYPSKSYYLSILSPQPRKFNDSIENKKILDQDQAVFHYLDEKNNYLGKINFATGETQKIIDTEFDFIELLPVANQLFFYSVPSEAGSFTHIYRVDEKQPAASQIDQFDDLVSAAVVDSDHLLLVRSNTSSLYQISNQKFTDINNHTCQIAKKYNDWLYCVDQPTEKFTLAQINLSDQQTNQYQFNKQILSIGIIGDNIYIVAIDGLYLFNNN